MQIQILKKKIVKPKYKNNYSSHKQYKYYDKNSMSKDILNLNKNSNKETPNITINKDTQSKKTVYKLKFTDELFFNKILIKVDGNCLFRTLSYYFEGTQNNFQRIEIIYI